MARFDLMDFKWSVIQPLWPTKPRGVCTLRGSCCVHQSITSTVGR